MNKKSNGRVDIINNHPEAPDISKLFQLYDKIPANKCVTLREPTAGQWDESILSNTFFHMIISPLFRMEYERVCTINQIISILWGSKIVMC